MEEWTVPPIELNMGLDARDWAKYDAWRHAEPFGLPHRPDPEPRSGSPAHAFELWLMVAFVAGLREANRYR